MKILLILLTAVLLLLAGCQKDPSSDTQASSAQSQVGGTLGESSGEQNSAASQQTGRFAGSELDQIFDMTEASIEQLYGAPKSKAEETPYENTKVTVLTYETATFRIDQSTQRVYFAEVSDDKLPQLRGIKIGTAMDTILSQFEKVGAQSRQTFGNVELEILYGQYGGENSYGVVMYQGNIATNVQYNDGGAASVTYNLVDGKVHRIQFQKPF